MAKTLVFYYKYDQRKTELIVRDFLYSQVTDKKELFHRVVAQFKKQNMAQFKSPPKSGTKIRLTIDSRYLDLFKLKRYYLKEMGGEHYSEDLYLDEMTYNNRAKNYDNIFTAALSYNYIPYYGVSEKSPNSSKNDLSSLLGIKGELEYLYRSNDTPLYFYGSLGHMRPSNGNGHASTAPEKMKTFSFSPELSATLAFGKHWRKKRFSLYCLLEKSMEYNIDFSPADDQSFARETEFYFFGIGAKWMRVETKNIDISLRVNISYAISASDRWADSDREVAQSTNAYKASFEPRAQFDNGLFFGYRLDTTGVSGKRKATYYRNTLSIGKNFN